MLIITLISANTSAQLPVLSDSDQDEARGLLDGAGYQAGAGEWLEPECAAMLTVSDADIGDIADIRQALAPLMERMDIAIRPKNRGLPKLMLSDMDSTMIGQECIDELADYAGVRCAVEAITERAMQGELDFAASLTERVALLEGLSEHVIAQCLAERVRPNPGARMVVQTLRKYDTQTVLVSGGFHHFADPIAAELGFQGVCANRLDVENGYLTGTIAGTIVDAAMKAHILERERSAMQIDAAATMAIGDGANDIPMLETAGFSAAYHAKPLASQAADFAIRHNDLTAVLYALGLPRSQWYGSA